MRELHYLLAPHNTLIVRGPASIRLLSGKAKVLGAPLEKSRRLIVGHEKQLPLESFSEVNLEVLMGESGKVFEVEGSTVPASWKLAVEALTDMRSGVVAVVGGTDVGKSTLCTYVANELLSIGLVVRVIDADVGQADIGPPATIGSAVVSAHFPAPVDLEPDKLIFIGHVTPNHVQSKLISGIKRLVEADPENEFLTIINTDGWVLGPDAILYKINLISSVEPDLVIGISADSELQPILSSPQSRSMIVHCAKEVLERSRGDRRTIRQSSYRRYLDGGLMRKIPLHAIRIRKPKELPQLQLPLNNEFKNLLVGLSDENDYLLQIGILTNADNDSLHIFTRPVGHLRCVEFGYVKLLADGTELGFVDD
jgi:polynucleotide 5'-hydroxyl-kinase GRC3/NOL9